MFYLLGLDPDAVYTLRVSDNGEEITASGKALSDDGLTVSMNQPRMSLVIFFSEK